VHETAPLLLCARKSYLSFIKAYSTYPSPLRQYMHVRYLHLGHLAKSFALRDSPTDIASLVANSKTKKPERVVLPPNKVCSTEMIVSLVLMRRYPSRKCVDVKWSMSLWARTSRDPPPSESRRKPGWSKKLSSACSDEGHHEGEDVDVGVGADGSSTLDDHPHFRHDHLQTRARCSNSCRLWGCHWRPSSHVACL
jgi:hypothetical protein